MNHSPAEPFFLDALPGKRFCLYHPPAQETPLEQAFIYIHPFAEEMNKSRRMAALQAKALAAIGYGVLQIDLYGCGDSEGDFEEATWGIWQADIEYAYHWLTQQGFTVIHCWGIRLGALLALDCAGRAGINIAKLVLWQPVTNGKSFLTQFLRLKLVNQLLAEDGNKTSSVKGFRELLNTGKSLEVAGYMLSSAMAAAIDELKLRQLLVKNSEIYWFEVATNIEHEMSPASASIVAAWNQSGIYPKVVRVPGLLFWSTQEISECPELLSATTRIFAPMTGTQP
jgi:exosortase A-associated hydrolase 2